MRKYLSDQDFSYITEELINNKEFISNLANNWNPIPEDFQRCSYIQSQGLEYIQTECVLNGNSEVVIDFEFTNLETPLAMFGCRIGVTENAFGIWGQNSPDQEHKKSGNKMVGLFPQYGSVSYNENPIFINPLQRVAIHMTPTYCAINNEKVEWEKTNFSTQSRLTIFNMNSSEEPDDRRGIGKLYGCRVYENNILTLFLVPVVKMSTGEAGMFDIISSSFFGNVGEGSFMAG